MLLSDSPLRSFTSHPHLAPSSLFCIGFGLVKAGICAPTRTPLPPTLGKSTLADRLMEATGALGGRATHSAQYLDKLQVGVRAWGSRVGSWVGLQVGVVGGAVGGGPGWGCRWGSRVGRGGFTIPRRQAGSGGRGIGRMGARSV